MALIHSFESSGNFLFKYRGQLPVILFALAIPFLYTLNYNNLSPRFICCCNILAPIVSITGLFIRGYAISTTPKGTSGRNTSQQVAEDLNTKGIYSLLRHPLYLGNYLAWIGIVIFTYNICFFIIVSLLFWLYYERIMFAEERFLERKFGQSYLDWSLKVPAFIPSTKHYIPGSVPFSIKTLLRREYSGWLACAVGYAFVSGFRNYFSTGKWFVSQNIMLVTLLVAIICLILRSLKHYTNILSETERS